MPFTKWASYSKTLRLRPPISMYKRVMGVLRETFLFESHGCDIQNQRLLYLSNVPNKNLPILSSQPPSFVRTIEIKRRFVINKTCSIIR